MRQGVITLFLIIIGMAGMGLGVFGYLATDEILRMVLPVGISADQYGIARLIIVAVGIILIGMSFAWNTVIGWRARRES